MVNIRNDFCNSYFQYKPRLDLFLHSCRRRVNLKEHYNFSSSTILHHGRCKTLYHTSNSGQKSQTTVNKEHELFSTLIEMYTSKYGPPTFISEQLKEVRINKRKIATENAYLSYES